MAFDNAVIRFDTNPVGAFYSGQHIVGSLLLDLERPIKISVLYIQFLGEAKVLWTENETETVNGVKEVKEIKYEGCEEYFNSTIQLAGGTGGVSNLPAGAQAFRFEFQIPFTAPSSFKGEQGGVFYSINVHLLHADPSIMNKEMTKPFQVVAPFDLNLGSPRIKEPINLEFEEVYGCGCFCTPDPVTIRVQLPISGYCPGQTIPVSVEVENESTVEITKMIFQLVSKELYRSQRPASEYIPPETILVTAKQGSVLAHCKRNFICDLVVPDMIAPYLENCSIIDVGYFFRITIKLSGCNDELQDESELCLGLVPLREFTEGQYVHPLAHSLPTGPIPVSDGTHQLTVPAVNNFAGSNTSISNQNQYNSGSYNSLSNQNQYNAGSHTSLQRIQYPPVQTSAYSDDPPPYSSETMPFPTENRFQPPVSIDSKPKPYHDFEIGFKLPQSFPSGHTPYPSNVPNVNPPYPIGNLMPSVAKPPYPTDDTMPNVASGVPAYAPAAFAPSAPPPID